MIKAIRKRSLLAALDSEIKPYISFISPNQSKGTRQIYKDKRKSRVYSPAIEDWRINKCWAK
jgi:hypothetical protein